MYLRKLTGAAAPVGNTLHFFSPLNAKNSNSKCEIALKEIRALTETIVPGSAINEIRSS